MLTQKTHAVTQTMLYVYGMIELRVKLIYRFCVTLDTKVRVQINAMKFAKHMCLRMTYVLY